MIRYLFAPSLLLSMVFAGQPAIADPREDAAAAFDEGDFRTVYRLLAPLAKKEDAEAQTTLGILYENGLGRPVDYLEAAKWYLAAAKQGVPAAVNLAFHYEKGIGVEADPREAFGWYRLAAERGDLASQLIVGDMYLSGRGGDQDPLQAFKWFSIAANRYPEQSTERAEARRKRFMVAVRLTPEQQSEGDQLAAAWQPK